MQMDTLRELYIAELKDLYSAEKQLVAALPKMAKCASNPELRRAFENHLAETEGHVERLEQSSRRSSPVPAGRSAKGWRV